MKLKFLLFFYVVVRAISAELESERSLQTGNAYPKLSTFLQEILNRESLLQFTMTQKILKLTVDSKKKDEEISNLNQKIRELQTSQMEGKTKLLSHLEDFQTFSLTVNETLQIIQENQSAGYIKLMDVQKKSGKSFKKCLHIFVYILIFDRYLFYCLNNRNFTFRYVNQ